MLRNRWPAYPGLPGRIGSERVADSAGIGNEGVEVWETLKELLRQKNVERLVVEIQTRPDLGLHELDAPVRRRRFSGRNVVSRGIDAHEAGSRVFNTERQPQEIGSLPAAQVQDRPTQRDVHQ